jgi:hypothetical protein
LPGIWLPRVRGSSCHHAVQRNCRYVPACEEAAAHYSSHIPTMQTRTHRIYYCTSSPGQHDEKEVALHKPSPLAECQQQV